MNDLFGTKHIILIAISAVLIVVGIIFARKLQFKTACKLLLYIAIVCEFIKTFYFIITNEEKFGGTLPKTDLPFHLCSIQLVFILFVCFAKNEKFKRAVLSFMMPSCIVGGSAAILISSYSSRNGLWIITTQYYGYHVALVIFGLYLLLNKELKLNIKDYLTSLLFVFILMFVSIYLNSILYDGVHDINFMYVVGPPQSGLPYLTEKYGWVVYICHYAMLIFVALTLCYIKPIINFFRKKKVKVEK